MGHIIAFDPQTASALAARMGTAAQLGHGSPLKAALASDTATLLLPAPGSDRVLVVRVSRHTSPAAQVPQKKRALPADDMVPVAYEASGLLGLEDSPIYAHDLEPQPKKKWWQKILE
jgi:hypothetical protein